MKHRILSILAVLAVLMIGIVPLSAQVENDVYPVTIEHKFGSTTIEAEPQRIVVLGYTEQDPYFALGASPVAIRYWYGDESAIFPWAEEAANGAEPIVFNFNYGELNYEAILELEPDLISAIDSGISEEEYELLSQIAPTVAQYDTYIDFGMPWQETTRLVGTILGKSDEAEALISGIETQFDIVREENPQFNGKTVSVSYYLGDVYGYYTDQDSRARFFTDLGFVVPEEQNEIAGENFYAYISEERLDLFDQDLLVFLGLQFFEGGSEAAQEAYAANPLLSQLTAVQEDRVLYVPDDFDDALQFSTVLSLGYLLDGLVPDIAAIFPPETAAAATCDAGLRAVSDALGESVCVPENPERIVGLMEADVDALLALGITPVGATNGRGQLTPPRYLADYLTDVASVGRFYSPNLEVLLELDPDLILFGGFTDETVLAQLNAIAPTVNTFQTGENWQSHFSRVADVLNMQAEAEAFIADYDARVAEIQANLGENATDSFIVARWSAEGPQIMAPTLTFSGGVLLDLGLTPASDIPELQDGHPHSDPLSLESLELLDVDWAFIGTLNPEGDDVTALDDALNNPLFQTLEVVQNEQVVFVDGSLWTSVGGPLAAMLVLDDVEAALVGSE